MGIGKPQKNFPAEIVLKKCYMEIGKRYRFRKLPGFHSISEKEFLVISLSDSYVRIQIVGMSRYNSIHIRDWDFFVQPDPIIQLEPSQGKLPFKFV